MNIDGVKNVKFKEVTYCEEVGEELPVFELTDIPAERWYEMAKESNTEAFIKMVGRQPNNYNEVLNWVYSLIEEIKMKKPTHCNELVSVDSGSCVSL